MNKEVKLYYFGCWKDKGHFFYTPDGSRIKIVGPFEYNIDTVYPPKTESYEDESVASLNLVDGWTVLAMWDRSVDKRHQSNSAFIAKGELTVNEMWLLVKEHYPHIFNRLKASPKDV